MKLLMDFIKECKTSTGEILVPRYDKSLHEGRGDRAPKSQWVEKQGAIRQAWLSRDIALWSLTVCCDQMLLGPLDVLLIEGWCMGFQAFASGDHLRYTRKFILYLVFMMPLSFRCVAHSHSLEWLHIASAPT